MKKIKTKKFNKEGDFIKNFNNYSKNKNMQNKSMQNKNTLNKNMQNNNCSKILFVTEYDKEIFKLVKNDLKSKLNKKYRIEYLNLNYLNKKIRYYNLVFLINSNLEEIKKINKIINFIKIRHFVKKEKINILFAEDKNNSIDLKVLKIIFKDYNVLGKIKFNEKEIFNKKIINKMKGMIVCN